MQPNPLPVVDAEAARCEQTLREIQQHYHVPHRRCGDCTVCCTVMPVTELAKPPYVTCSHCGPAGCGVYESRPLTCRGWSCEWWTGRLGLTDSQRPDKLGVMFSYHPRFIVAHESRPGTALSKEAIRVLNRVKSQVALMFVRATGRAFRLGEGDAGTQIEREEAVESRAKH
jgi:hypothetical protein